jgi:DNA-binding MarR family transcriptional regulator
VDSLHRRGASLIIQTIPKLMGWLASDLRKAEPNLSPGHFHILLVLAQGGCSLTDLASRLEVSLPTMSNTISTLDERGWVSRKRDAGDHRRLKIELTTQGQAVLEHITAEALKKAGQILDPLTDEECRQIIVGLETLNNALSDVGISCCLAASPGRASHSGLSPLPLKESK